VILRWCWLTSGVSLYRRGWISNSGCYNFFVFDNSGLTWKNDTHKYHRILICHDSKHRCLCTIHRQLSTTYNWGVCTCSIHYRRHHHFLTDNDGNDVISDTYLTFYTIHYMIWWRWNNGRAQNLMSAMSRLMAAERIYSSHLDPSRARFQFFHPNIWRWRYKLLCT